MTAVTAGAEITPTAGRAAAAPPDHQPQGPPLRWTMPTPLTPHPTPPTSSPPDERRVANSSIGRVIGGSTGVLTGKPNNVAWPVLLSWAGGVILIVLAAVVAFALWLSGGRNESVQRQGFKEFRSASLLISEGAYPEKVWPENLPVALIRFQRFGRSVAVFGGIGKNELRRGPGYDPTTPMIGELGNTVLIGKSATYGSPFADLDKVLVGDQLVVKSGYGSLAYRVTEVLTVDRNAPQIYEPVPDDSRLSLVGHHGHPLSSERVLVRASLDATGALHDVTLPLVPPNSPMGFAPLLIAGLVGAVAIMVMVGEKVLPQFTTRRAARWIIAPLTVALAVPLAEQLLLALPRTW